MLKHDASDFEKLVSNLRKMKFSGFQLQRECAEEQGRPGKGEVRFQQ